MLLASKLGLPVSTTHCKVGAVVCMAWLVKKLGVESGSDSDDKDTKDVAFVATQKPRQEGQDAEKATDEALPISLLGNESQGNKEEEEEEGKTAKSGAKETKEDDKEKAGEDGEDSSSAVNWKLCFQIGAAWILTLPLSGAVSALVFFLLKSILPSSS